jgi:plastocyanin
MTISLRPSAALLLLAALAALALPACKGDVNQVATNGIPPASHAPAKSTATTKPGKTAKPAKPTPSTDLTIPAGGIVIVNFSYQNMVAKAHQVTKVVNKDAAPHTLTADDLSFDTKTIDANGTGEFTAPGPGTYKIHCIVHPFMTAELKVVS